ncbi:hypothetical protein DFH06DRAFT_475407 [Mycena polygramma]|nr:hypothetical protein DFH06DRAFT_475407 [Mycena polygramma]
MQYAMQSLPVEVLGQIFISCRDSSLGEPKYQTTNPAYAPRVLTHVCSRWRMVALSTPRLWDNIQLPTSAFMGGEKIGQEILAHSCHVPLSLALLRPNTWIDMPSVDDYNHRRWLDVVWDCSHRLQSISLTIHQQAVALHMLPLHTAFPRLSSIDMLVDYGSRPDLRTILESFQTAPLLRSLNLRSTAEFEGGLPEAIFPWSQLTNVDLTRALSIGGARHVLAQCPALASARLCCLFERDTDRSSSPRELCTLRHLSELDISINWGTGIAVLLDKFSMPQLSSLSLFSFVLDPPATTLLALHARSQLSLTHLSLRHQDLALLELISLLDVFPTLETLVIENCTCTSDYLFDALMAPAADQPRLAHGRLLTLEIHPISYLTGHVVACAAEYLAARVGDPTGAFPLLRSLRLHPENRRFIINKFSRGIEKRLDDVCATGFLAD